MYTQCITVAGGSDFSGFLSVLIVLILSHSPVPSSFFTSLLTIGIHISNYCKNFVHFFKFLFFIFASFFRNESGLVEQAYDCLLFLLAKISCVNIFKIKAIKFEVFILLLKLELIGDQ